MQCVLSVRGPNYQDDQTHTWRIIPGSPVLNGVFRQWPAVWSVQGSGNRTLDTGVSETWKSAVPPTNAPLAFSVNTVTGQMRIGSQHGLLNINGAITGSTGGRALPIIGALQEWPFPIVDDVATGTIRVTAPEGIAYLILTPLLGKFHTLHPRLKVDVILTDRILDLSNGDADIALRAAPLEDSALIGRKIADLAWGFYASRSYAERQGSMSGPEDINRHAVIQFDRELADIQVSKWLRGIVTEAPIAARCSSVSGALLTVKSGVGVALLPSHIGDTEKDLVRLFGPLKDIVSGCYLIAHPDLHKTPRVRAFFDFMIEEIEQFRPMLLGRTSAQ